MTRTPWTRAVLIAALPAFPFGPTAAALAAQANPPPARTVLGTTQVGGLPARLGETFTLGQKSPLNFTLVRAEYSLGRVTIGTTTYFPRAGEKLLVLHFTVHNPQKVDVRYYWPDVRFTAVDAQDRNVPYVQAVARDGTSESLEVRLKPAQKISVQTLVRVPAAGVTPKLLVARDGEQNVLRYDLRGQVTPLPTDQADPSDPSGATARTRLNVTPGVFFPLQDFDLRIDSFAFTTEAVNGQVPGPGQRNLSVILTIRNATPRARPYAWSDFRFDLRDADGEKVTWNGLLLKAGRDEKSSGTLNPGEEARVRVTFPLPVTVSPQTLTVSDSSGRLSDLDVSGAR